MDPFKRKMGVIRQAFIRMAIELDSFNAFGNFFDEFVTKLCLKGSFLLHVQLGKFNGLSQPDGRSDVLR